MRRSRLGVALGLVVAGCSGTEETLRIVFPEDAAGAASRLVVTVVDPTAGADAGTPFASCQELGTFRPTRLIPGGAAQPNAPGVLERFEAELPVEEADFTLPARRSSADNPWGVVAVLVEAVGPVVDGSQPELEPEPLFGEASVLQSCYCARTLAGRHPDPELDARVKEACPFAGGAGGTGPVERELLMGPIAPDEFVLGPCGTASGALVAQTDDQRTAPACIRTQLCEDVAPGSLCFDCESPCDRAADLSGAVLEYRVVTGPLLPERQRVTTNPAGEGWPVFSSIGCGSGDEAEVEVSVPGRRTGAIRFPVRCVGGTTLEIVAGTDEATSPNEEGIDFEPSIFVHPGDPSRVLVGTRFELQAWRRQQDGFLPGPTALFPDGGVVASALYGRNRADGVDVAAVGWSVYVGGAHRVALARYRWAETTLELLEPAEENRCGTCTCGSRSCAAGEACDEGETCVDGACRPADCPCFYAPRRSNDLSSGAGDFDGDENLDVLVTTDQSIGSTSYYGADDGSTAGCRCDLNEFSASSFVLADLDADGREDTVWQRDEGPALRLAQDRTSFCGNARPLGPPLEQPVLASAALRCAAGSSCVGSDLVTLSRFRRGRVLFSDPAVLSADLERFERPQTHSRFFLPRPDMQRTPRIRQVEDGDFDGDGYLDVAIVFTAKEMGIELLFGDGRGNLIPFPRQLSPADFGCQEQLRLASGDSDGDGRSETIARCGERIRVVEIR